MQGHKAKSCIHGEFKCPTIVIREKKVKTKEADFSLYLVNNFQQNTVRVRCQYFYQEITDCYAIIQGIDIDWLRNLNIRLSENDINLINYDSRDNNI